MNAVFHNLMRCSSRRNLTAPPASLGLPEMLRITLQAGEALRAGLIRWALLGCLVGQGAGLTALGKPTRPAAPRVEDTNSTVITSTRLSFDQQKRIAIFQDHVVVTDPHVNITSDRLTVLFTEDNQVASIEAHGNVVIKQGDKKATGEKARYEVREGKVVLTGCPMVQRGRDELSAGTITFWRDSNRIVCEPNARLVIRSEEDIYQGPFTKE